MGLLSKLFGSNSHQNLPSTAKKEIALDVVTEKWARDYSPATRKALRLTVGDVMTQEGGFTIPQLTTTVDKIPEIHTNDSAKVMAQTLSYAATNFANLKAWKESGVVKTVVWYTMKDNNVCELCAPLDGKEVPTGADFFTADYGNGNHPPLHLGCRCGLRPEKISIE